MVKRREKVKPAEAKKELPPYLLWAVVVYALLIVLVPMVAYAFVLISGKNNVLLNIAGLYSLTSNFLKALTSYSANPYFFPSPPDFILASIAVLYRRKWKISAGIAAAGGFVFAFGQYFADLLNYLINGVGQTSVAGLIIETLYTALAAGIMLAYVFFPAAASYMQGTRWKVIVPINLIIGWIPPVWILLNFFAIKSAKKPVKVEKADGKQEKSTVHKHELKKKKGYRKK